MTISDICIQGDPLRSKDIIKFFEVMGVKNRINVGAERDCYYYYASETGDQGSWIGAIEQTKKTLIRLQSNSLLPESWCVRTPCETVLNWINNNLEPHEDGQREYYSVGDGWFGSLDGRRWCDNHAWAIDLTESQFLALSGYKPEQKEQREIIGYKCPMDLYGGSFKKGEIWIKRDALTYQPFDNPVGVYLPAEIVELWEPVYKEEPVLIAGNEVELLQKYVHWNGDAMSYHTFGELMSALKVFKATHLTISGEQVPVEILQSIQSKLK